MKQGNGIWYLAELQNDYVLNGGTIGRYGLLEKKVGVTVGILKRR